jgi:hypothetical protein
VTPKTFSVSIEDYESISRGRVALLDYYDNWPADCNDLVIICGMFGYHLYSRTVVHAALIM